MNETEQLQRQTAYELVRTFRAGDSTRAGAAIRRIFAVDPDVERTPLARLLQQRDGRGGGPGGALRLQLYVSLVWVCTKPPYDTDRPARVWAQLLGLDDAAGNGTRRIRAALAELDAREFVRLERRGARTTNITVLSDIGDGSPYVVPGAEFDRRRDTIAEGDPERKRLVYFRVPNEIWTEGSIAALDGPGFAMLLILLAESRGYRRPVWFSPGHADEYYGIAAATRSRGIDELVRLGLVAIAKEPVNATTKYGARRNVYTLPFLDPDPTRPQPGRIQLLPTSPTLDELAGGSI